MVVANIWVMVAEKWNDADYLPVMSVKLETHSNFVHPIYCAFEAVSYMQPATPEKVEERWNSMNLALNHVIPNWEMSGQESGGFINKDDECEEDKEDDIDDEEEDSNNNIGTAFGSLSDQAPQSLELW